MLDIRVPAMRGKMGSRTYYSCLMPLKAIPQFFKFTDWAGISAEDREQRVLKEKRVPELASYITDNEEDYLFSAITASYKSSPRFEPYEEGQDIAEYALMLAVILVIVVGTIRLIGSNANNVFSSVGSAIQ